jgi:DNA-binding beta-propeller fold protein YncE
MSSLISDSQKQAIRDIVDMIHDTFARDIVVYKQGKKVSFVTSGGYNALYKKNPTVSQVELEQNSRTIKARIKYQSFDQTNFYQESSQEKIVIPEGVVYIKVNKDGYDYIKDAKTVELDGITYAIKSPGKPEGIFGPHYYKFLLIPLES